MKQVLQSAPRADGDQSVDEWCTEFWGTGALIDSIEFNQRLRQMETRMIGALEDGDQGALLETIQRTEWLWDTGRIASEVMLAAYESSICRLSLVYADFLLRHEDYAGVYAIAESVLDTTRQSASRRVDAGLEIRPYNQLKIHAWRLLAEAKAWDAPERAGEYVSPANLIAHAYAADQFARISLAMAEGEAYTRIEAIEDHLAWMWLAVGRMALLYAPKQVPEIVSHFNTHYGPIFTEEIADWYSRSSVNRASVFYWEWEFAKLQAAIHHKRDLNEVQPQDVYHCYQQAEFAQQAKQPGRMSQVAYLTRLKQEADTIARRLAASRFSVLPAM